MPKPKQSKGDRRRAQNQPEIRELVRTAEKRIFEKKLDQHPRKQFVRRYGWLEIIERYHQRRLEAGVGNPLKFLTLPGENATDLGLLWSEGYIIPDADGVLNVAVCDFTSAEVVAANISPLGTLLACCRQYLHVALRANENLIDQFPFDVINMDLYSALLVDAKNQDNLEAIEGLFRLQGGQSFLLLLTTNPYFQPKITAQLVDVVKENIQNRERFNDSYCVRYGEPDPNLCARDVTKFAQLVYPKVIARYSRDYGYRMQEHFVGQYTRQDKTQNEYQMVCHSFEFEPVGKQEDSKKYAPRTGRKNRTAAHQMVFGELSPAHRKESEIAYEDFIVNLPLRETVFIDEIIDNNMPLEKRLAKEAIDLDQWWTRIP